MTTFIQEVINHVLKSDKTISEYIFILPSRRAGVFFKHELAKLTVKTLFAPKILSIEDFIEELSQLQQISNTEALFEFYEIYCSHTNPDEIESFDAFSKWAQILLQDFNEIDRFLVSPQKVFRYLAAIQDINHWSLEENQTQLIKNHLSFWNRLETYYQNFTKALLKKEKGYQGLLYREAVANLEAYLAMNSKEHLFLGFNALNAAEERIIQEFLDNEIATVFWDVDQSFLENPYHDSMRFIKQYQKKWKYYTKNSFKWISNNFVKPKNISVLGVPKNIGQAKQVGLILQELENSNINLLHTAVVLADENLLLPTLNSLPETVEHVNVTMGYPLKSVPLASLFEQLFDLHKTLTKAFYYQDIINLLSHPFLIPLINKEHGNAAKKIIQIIQKNNLVYITKDRLNQIDELPSIIFNVLFILKENTVSSLLDNMFQLIFLLKENLDEDKFKNQIALEQLYCFHELFLELIRLNSKYNHIKDTATLHNIYKELLNNATLDFKGEPLQGLQIMGMLESRALDFETVIITSVNEGVLPTGNTANSFIPFDVKLENKMPTYQEKDAIFSFHFYRLLQRAKNIYLLYNTETDALSGGEKSRFITQLELENMHSINHKLVFPQVSDTPITVKQIEKNNAVLQQLKIVAKKGFSPSSLTNYIRNPIDFYHQKILGIYQAEEIEENVALNTLGTVIHNTLEALYQEQVGQFLTVNFLKNAKPKIANTITKFFKEAYKEGDLNTGKNLIIFEIAKRYVNNFIDQELHAVKNGNQIQIIALEKEIHTEIENSKFNFTIKLTGKVDRIDNYNGTLRVIDYKTGRVEQSQLNLSDWDTITTDYDKYSKSFQVLMYAYMLSKNEEINLPVEAGIISFRNLQSGFLKFTKKHDKQKSSIINSEILAAFEAQLIRLIEEIFNPKVAFTEKEVN